MTFEIKSVISGQDKEKLTRFYRDLPHEGVNLTPEEFVDSLDMYFCSYRGDDFCNYVSRETHFNIENNSFFHWDEDTKRFSMITRFIGKKPTYVVCEPIGNSGLDLEILSEEGYQKFRDETLKALVLSAVNGLRSGEKMHINFWLSPYYNKLRKLEE
ncbi:hypothetical protein HYW74_04760 [Candidatus Pacearchaeota archaeon]|nr:hypothetical protein [Candidatus Pacearchaeota archaeon]